jgi:hypothetical protein
MKWTLRKAEAFVQLNQRGCEGRYRHRAHEIAAKLGCTTASIQSMRRKVKRLESLRWISSGYDLALLLLAPEYFVQGHLLHEIDDHARRDLVKVRQFVRRGHVSGRPHLVGPYKRNIASTAAEATP